MAMESKRKTSTQLQALEHFYSEEKYPTKRAMEDYAVGLGLTYKQVRGWFVERRRREKKENGAVIVSSPPSLPSRGSRKNGVAVTSQKILKKQSAMHGGKIKSSFSKFRRMHLLESNATQKGQNKQNCARRCDNPMVENRTGRRKKKAPVLLQDLLFTPDYILKKVFRKDGPPLGVEFDFLPSRAFCHFKDSSNSRHAGPENPRALKRRKVLKHALEHQECNKKSAPAKKHGIGKGLMTVWRATNLGAGDFPTGVDLADIEITGTSPISISMSRRSVRKKKLQQQRPMKERKLKNKLQDKRKVPLKRREGVGQKDVNQKQQYKESCELALGGVIPQEHLEKFAMLVDDEELELSELQGGPNPLACTSHFAGTGLHHCSLCKDLLAKFPPSYVKMKQPISKQPWVSSPEAVKKLFKVFHFLYTYAVLIDMRSFTLDEFAQAFHDKDSLLLGEVHVALLKVLLSDVEIELSSGSLPHLSKSCKFLGLLHSIEHQHSVVGFWRRSLNPLTWTEILRQVFVATGSGSQNGASQRETLSKEVTRMVKYGLCPGTLKSELFSILSEQGNNGMVVSELAKSFQIVELNLASTTDELENLICSTLSSDITLFEKISSSAYRLRIGSVTDEADNFDSDTEDSGSVDDNSEDNGICSSSDESECDSGNSVLRNRKRINHHKNKNMLTVCTEIDESHPGEIWLLGLSEVEYSDLRIEEKLNALVALVDLLSAGSSIRMEDPTRSLAECIPNNHHYGSGAKIKRSSALPHNLLGPPSSHVGQMHTAKAAHTSSESCPIDSSASISKFFQMQKSYSNRKDVAGKEEGIGPHPMQSVFVGSDRRYNRYWLFLGPCTDNDPGHKRVYFESSEDGHWEVIDSEEALHALLSILDDRGKREARLVASLEKRGAALCQEMSNKMASNYETRHSTISDQSELDREDSSSPMSNVDNNLCLSEISEYSLAQSGAKDNEVGRKAEEEQRWNRLQAFDAWIWHSFYLDLHAVKHSKSSYLDSLARCKSCHDLYWRDEKHCKICHATFELDFDLEDRYAIHVATCRTKEDSDIISKHKILSSQLQSLKAAIHVIESVMPEDSLVGAWTKSAHKVWVKRLRRTSSLSELLQVLTDFVCAINEEWLCRCNVELSSNNVLEEIITNFQTMPQTFSAVALWLVKLDAVIAPYLERESSEYHQEMGKKLRVISEYKEATDSCTNAPFPAEKNMWFGGINHQLWKTCS